MTIQALKKTIKAEDKNNEVKIEEFIAQGGTLAQDATNAKSDNKNKGAHRLTLRIPKILMEKIDSKRKERISTISRNQWILELIERSTCE